MFTTGWSICPTTRVPTLGPTVGSLTGVSCIGPVYKCFTCWGRLDCHLGGRGGVDPNPSAIESWSKRLTGVGCFYRQRAGKRTKYFPTSSNPLTIRMSKYRLYMSVSFHALTPLVWANLPVSLDTPITTLQRVDQLLQGNSPWT